MMKLVETYRAETAQVDISPPLGELIVGGFAPFPATAVHDKLHARCLILDNGQTQIAFVICDNLGILREVYQQAYQIISIETELETDRILMAATPYPFRNQSSHRQIPSSGCAWNR